jgi:hypothetical protein
MQQQSNSSSSALTDWVLWAVFHSELSWNYEPYRQPVGLLERGISPVVRPLPTQGDTNTEETRIDTHASSAIRSKLRLFNLLKKEPPPPPPLYPLDRGLVLYPCNKRIVYAALE